MKCSVQNPNSVQNPKLCFIFNNFGRIVTGVTVPCKMLTFRGQKISAKTSVNPEACSFHALKIVLEVEHNKRCKNKTAWKPFSQQTQLSRVT